jgi:hypothetical protein
MGGSGLENLTDAQLNELDTRQRLELIRPLAHPTGDTAETYRMYYQLQYERVAAHESGRLQVSNFVLAGSLVGIGLASGVEDVGGMVVAAAMTLVVALNGFAVAAAINHTKWVKIHQARAAFPLRALSADIGLMQSNVNRAFDVPTHSDERDSIIRSERLLIAMHVSVSLIAVVSFTGFATR